MPNFTIYQPILTREQVDLINAHGWTGSDVARTYAKLDMPHWGDEAPTIGRLIRDAIDCDLFTMTAAIRAVDLHDVVTIGNMGPEQHITRREGFYMRNVTCGDIIVDEATGQGWFVLTDGFAELADDTLAALRDACGWRDADAAQTTGQV